MPHTIESHREEFLRTVSDKNHDKCNRIFAMMDEHARSTMTEWMRDNRTIDRISLREAIETGYTMGSNRSPYTRKNQSDRTIIVHPHEIVDARTLCTLRTNVNICFDNSIGPKLVDSIVGTSIARIVTLFSANHTIGCLSSRTDKNVIDKEYPTIHQVKKVVQTKSVQSGEIKQEDIGRFIQHLDGLHPEDEISINGCFFGLCTLGTLTYLRHLFLGGEVFNDQDYHTFVTLQNTAHLDSTPHLHLGVGLDASFTGMPFRGGTSIFGLQISQESPYEMSRDLMDKRAESWPTDAIISTCRLLMEGKKGTNFENILHSLLHSRDVLGQCIQNNF